MCKTSLSLHVIQYDACLLASLTIYKVLILLACLTGAGDGCRVYRRTEQLRHRLHPWGEAQLQADNAVHSMHYKHNAEGVFDQLTALARLFLALDPVVAFGQTHARFPSVVLVGPDCIGYKSSNRFRRHEPAPVMSSDDEPGDQSDAAGSAFTSPAAALQQWRAERINLFGSVLDCSRYHVQVLIVDDDSLRARTCHAILERVAEWADAGWWIYPHSTSLGEPFYDKDDRSWLTNKCQPFDLSSSILLAPTSQFDVNDVLEDTYDLIVCVDLEVQQKVRSLVREASATEYSGINCSQPDAMVLSLCDFLAIGGDRINALDEQLQDLVSGEYFRGLAGLAELPRTSRYRPEKWRQFLAGCALTSAGMTTYLKNEFDNFFVTSFKELLTAHYNRAEHLNVSWDECEEAMRRHIVTGGLTIAQRQQLFEVHLTNLRERLSDST